MNDPRCCGSGACIINNDGECWCGQRWDGEKMCFTYVETEKKEEMETAKAAPKKGVKASTELVKTGEKKLGAFGKLKQGYNTAIDKTVGNLGKGKTVLGSDLNKSLKTTVTLLCGKT